MFKTVAEARAARQKALETMEASAASGGETFDSAKAAFTTADEAVKRLEFVEAEKIKSAQPVEAVTELQPGRVKALSREKPGMKAARFVRVLAAEKGLASAAATRAVKDYGEDYGGEIAKALTAGSLAGGGATIPEDMSSELITLLRAAVVVRKMGARQIPLPNGTATMKKMTGGGTASYIGESQKAPHSQQTFGNLKLSAKKLSAKTGISNDLLRYSNEAIDQLVLDDLIAAISLAEDAAFLRGTGTEYTPKGIRNSVAAGNLIAANATVNLANVTADLGKLELALMNANVRMINPGWVLSPTSHQFLKNIQNAFGVKAFPELDSGLLRGYPVGMTTQVPSNLGSGTNESEVYFGNFADFVIGDGFAIDVKVSSEASYDDGNGIRSAFDNDETVINAIESHDCGLRYDQSFAVLTGAIWR